MTSNLYKQIHDHFSQFTNLSGKDDAMAFVHAMARFYPNDVTPVGGHGGAIGHWWLESSTGKLIDPFNPEGEWHYDARQRGIKELTKMINLDNDADHIHQLSSDILETVSNKSAFSFESKIGEDDEFDEDFEDEFDFLYEEPKPQGPRP